MGRLLDVFGTRMGIAVSVAFYSLMGALTAVAGSKFTFAGFRFLLGAGEAANNPGGAKAVSEWFPVKERALAVALYNSGCAIGAFAAPFIAVFIYETFHSWRPAFVITATMGVCLAGSVAAGVPQARGAPAHFEGRAGPHSGRAAPPPIRSVRVGP